MKIQENFLFNTNYVNHNRNEVNHDNFFQWKMRYRLNQSKYNNASTHNNDKIGIAFKAIEIKPTKRPALMSVCMTHKAVTHIHTMQGKSLGKLSILGIWASIFYNIEGRALMAFTQGF